MESRKHIIHQQVVEIDFYDKSASQGVFAQFSRLFNTKLESITNLLLDKTVNGQDMIKIDQLELNIGTLTYPFSDDEFADRYEQALEKALLDYATLHTLNATEVKPESIQSFARTPIDVLHFFLSNGVLPRWESGDLLTQPDKIFLKLFDDSPEQLKRLLLKIGVVEQVRKRLSQQFEAEIILGSIKLIEPFQVNFISRYFDNVVRIRKEKQIIQTQEKVFGQALWYFILSYLFVDMGGHFERKNFVKSTLSQMASHFNISYHTLLNLLSTAIQINPELIQSDKNFTRFIKELSEETTTDSEVNPALSAGTYLEKVPEKDQFEALHYYLFFGSLPVEYSYYTPQKISLLLEVIVKKHPETFLNVIAKQHNSTLFTERLMLVASEVTLLAIIRVMETTNSDFIISYYQTTVKIQNKKSLIKTQESEFKKAILKFILSFLFASHGSLFSARMFVENNIKNLAQHYNIDYRTLLLIMTQGMAEINAIVKSQSSLFFIFTEILGEIRNSTTSTFSIEKIKPEKDEFNEKNKVRGKANRDKTDTAKITLQDLFLFWLTHGTIPWWAKEQKSETIAELLEQLIQTESDTGLLLIKQATQLGFRKHLILNTVSKSVLDLFKRLPDGESVVKIGNEFRQLGTLSKIGISKDSLHGFLLQAILETYHQTQFNSFSPQRFYAILVHYLKRAGGMSEETIEKFFAIQLTENTLPYFKSIIADRTKKGQKENDVYQSVLFLDRTEGYATKGISSSDSFSPDEFKLLLHSGSTLKMSSDMLVSKAYDVLKYYLLHNRLPDHIKAGDQLAVVKILERLVIVIFEQDQNLLHNLMREDNASPAAKMVLHKSFSKHSNQQGRNIANLLKEYEEKDLLIYIKESWKQEQIFTNLTEIIHFIKDQTSGLTQQQLHKEVLQLANTTLHYAGMYKGAAFTTMIKLLADNTLQELISSHMYILNIAIKDSFERDKVLLYFREFSFYWVAQTHAENVNLFFYRFLEFLNHKKNWNIKHLYQQLIAVPNDIKQLHNTSLQTLIVSIQKDTEAYLAQTHYWQEIMAPVKDEVLKKLDFTEYAVVTEPEDKSTERIYNDEVLKLNEGEKIYIENAGLVLIHPFLSTLFDRTGLIKNGEFTDEEKKLRAPHLLQYLVNHQQESPEEALLLNKILCGIAYQEPITSGIELTELERNTADELLYVVTQQWDKLKNTSTQGLQESFLQRGGFLCLSNEGWTLEVENKAYDVLLQTLPWGLSFIKNSWMNEPIFVVWS